MVRVDNTQREKADRGLRYTTGKIDETNVHLTEADEGIARLKAEPQDAFGDRQVNNYETQLTAKSGLAIVESVKMALWYLTDSGIPIPTAYTDDQVDAIDINIRTHEVRP